MQFNTSWSDTVIFTGGEDSTRRDKKFWNCKGKRGIYVFCDEWNREILYIGKAEDINDRLGKHSRGVGNREIFDLISKGETVRIRYSESHDESVLARKNDNYWNVRPGRRADEIQESLRSQISALEDKIRSKRQRLE